MATPERLGLSEREMAEYCRKWGIERLELFGSVLRDDFNAASDIDVLVTFAPGARRSMFDLVHMQDELEQLSGRHVDLVERASVEKSANYIRRSNILRSAVPVYGAR